jgi:hypothetical protein
MLLYILAQALLTRCVKDEMPNGSKQNSDKKTGDPFRGLLRLRRKLKAA